MTWFKVDDSFYDHPKVFDLPDSAVALWTRAGCWAARNLTDGSVPARLPARLCDDHEAAVRALVDSGLWRRTKGGYQFHDWDQYQPSRDEVTAERGKKSIGGRIGNHRRWHVDRGRFDPECVHCQRERGSDNRSDTDRKDRREPESDPNRPVPSRPDPSRRDGGTTSRPSTGSRRASDQDDDESTIDKTIIDTLYAETGRTVAPDWAAKVRQQILGGRAIDRPLPYIVKTLRERPNDFLPASDPADRPPPAPSPRDPDAYERGPAEARRLLAERKKAST